MIQRIYCVRVGIIMQITFALRYLLYYYDQQNTHEESYRKINSYLCGLAIETILYLFFFIGNSAISIIFILIISHATYQNDSCSIVPTINKLEHLK